MQEEERTVTETEGYSKEEKMWGMFCHLAALAGYIGIPFGNIIGPLVVWLIKKEEFKFVADQGKESLNFQISVTIYAIIAGILSFILIGIPLLIIILVGNIVLVIMAGIKANDGKAYRYPATIRIIK